MLLMNKQESYDPQAGLEWTTWLQLSEDCRNHTANLM